MTQSDWEALPLGEHVLAESPRWDAARQQLSWVDFVCGTVCAATRSRAGWSQTARHELGSLVTAAVQNPAGGWWVAVGAEVVTLTASGDVHGPRVAVTDDFPAVRTNDMVLDPAGHLLVGLFAEDRTSETGGVCRVAPATGQVRPVLEGLVTANGLGVSPDHRSLYAVDTARGTLTRFAYDLDTGIATDPEVLVHEPGPGRLDGLAVDRCGDVWLAVWGAGEVRRYDPDGRLRQTLRTPVARPSAVALVGDDEDLLVVSTARSDLTPTRGAPPPSDEGRLYAYPLAPRGKE